jgi:hypothetical protein
VHRQRRLADARHALHDHRARPHGLADQQVQLAEADRAAGEERVVGGQPRRGRPAAGRHQAHRLARRDRGHPPRLGGG